MADHITPTDNTPIIVTDATCDLPLTLMQEYDIRLLPIYIEFGADTYLGGTQMRLQEFIARMAQGDAHPTTRTFTPDEMVAFFNGLNAGKRPILAVLMSSKLSQTLQNAQIAAKRLAGTLDVTIHDSQTISGALGLQALTAARAARAGRSVPEILSLLAKTYLASDIFFCLDYLRFLHKGGRIGLVSFHVAKTLGLKPIITVSKTGDTLGTYVAGSERPRSLKQALGAFERAMAKVVSPRDPVRVLIPHGDVSSAQLASELKAILTERFHCVQLELFPASAVNAAHVGPHSLEIAFAPGDWSV